VLLVVKRKRFDPRKTLSLRAPRPISLLASLIAGASGWALVSQGTYWLLDVLGHDIRSIPSAMPLGTTLAVLTVVLAGPCEELLFRGFILTGVRQSYGAWTTVILTAFLFGLFHQDPVRLAGAFVLGLFFGILLLRSESIFCPIAAHMVNNLCAATLGKTHWSTMGFSAWQLAAFAGVLVLALLLARARQGSAQPSSPGANRNLLLVYGLITIVSAGVLSTLPLYQRTLDYLEPLKYRGTIQLDRFTLRDEYTYRKETQIILRSEQVAIWGEQGYLLRFYPEDRLISVKQDGNEVAYTSTGQNEVSLSFDEPPSDWTSIEIVCEGQAKEVERSIRYFAVFAYIPVKGIRTTVDIRLAPTLRYGDTAFRVVTRVYLVFTNEGDWTREGNWFGIVMYGKS
jgi:membrane protease YdiL (CAAX protease family)